MQQWRPEFELDGIFRQLVPLLTNKDRSLIERDCTAVVCKVVCCMEVRPGL